MHSESKGQESEEKNDAERVIRFRGSEGSGCSEGSECFEGSEKCGVLSNGVLNMGLRTVYSLGLSNSELNMGS